MFLSLCLAASFKNTLEFSDLLWTHWSKICGCDTLKSPYDGDFKFRYLCDWFLPTSEYECLQLVVSFVYNLWSIGT